MTTTFEQQLAIFSDPESVKAILPKNNLDRFVHKMDKGRYQKGVKGRYLDGRIRVKGVYQCSHYDKWMALAYVEGKKLMIYYGDSYDDAVATRRAYDATH
jgi:hypothetical protein